MVKTKKLPKLIVLLSLFYSVSTAAIQAAQHENLQQLKKQVETYITSQISQHKRSDFKVNIKALDKRLKLTSCETDIVFSLSGKQPQIRRNGTVKAECSSPQAWQIYIPYQAVQLTTVLVAARDIAKGEELTKQDVISRKQDLFVTRNASYTQASQVTGTHAKSAIRRGEIVNSHDLCSVCKGQPVTIIAVGSGIRLKTDGVALQDGIPGQIIRVENSRSGRKIKAKITSAGTVQVNI